MIVWRRTRLLLRRLIYTSNSDLRQSGDALILVALAYNPLCYLLFWLPLPTLDPVFIALLTGALASP
jgi:hypothetical protein